MKTTIVCLITLLLFLGCSEDESPTSGGGASTTPRTTSEVRVENATGMDLSSVTVATGGKMIDFGSLDDNYDSPWYEIDAVYPGYDVVVMIGISEHRIIFHSPDAPPLDHGKFTYKLTFDPNLTVQVIRSFFGN